jgi:hypothetical protein
MSYTEYSTPSPGRFAKWLGRQPIGTTFDSAVEAIERCLGGELGDHGAVSEWAAIAMHTYPKGRKTRVTVHELRALLSPWVRRFGNDAGYHSHGMVHLSTYGRLYRW